MKSGESRWIGRTDLHVFCWAPCDPVPMPDGRVAWKRRQPVYKLLTADCPPNVWDSTGWTTAADVARQIESILTREAAA